MIDAGTGAATQVGASFTLPQSAGAVAAPPATSGYGFDFNPTVDRIRVVSSGRDNFRLHPDTGAVAGVDTALTVGSNIVGSAYDRNFAGATVTTLFGIDATTDTLIRQGGVDGAPSPNLGVITTIGRWASIPAMPSASISFRAATPLSRRSRSAAWPGSIRST